MDSSRNATKVGLFVAATLTIIALLLLNFSKGAGLFSPSYRIYVISENVGGLIPDAKVLMSGVQVGSVERLDLAADGRAVSITLKILKKFAIHADARFEIEQSGFLGDQFVSIVPEKNLKDVLADGAHVTATKPFNLQEAARSAVGLMQKLDTAVDRINGAVARVDNLLLNDTVLTNLAATAENFRKVSTDAQAAVAEVRGVVATNAPMITLTLSNLNVLSSSLQVVATNVNATIDSARPELQAALHSAAGATHDLKELTAGLQHGDGVIGAVLKDDSLRLQFGNVVTNLATVSSNLAKYGILYKPKQKTVLVNETHYTGRGPGR
ncbi:MAG TPA: MlaD family protein [Candidatus Limnocylindria bacterium]|jgi:phospholipid/cholesterol/gamma-HCH transport system substrate-binding protein|nr:MlaD family protein [Candidatus Limnocylindria bacterium]